MTGSARATGHEQLRGRLQRELAHLETVERPHVLTGLAARDGWDIADQADRHARELELAYVDHRIERLRRRLAALDQARPAAPGVLDTGALVVIDVGDGPERYLIAEYPDRGSATITPDSPLGRALRGLRPGQRASFRTPRGEATVTLLGVEEPGRAVA